MTNCSVQKEPITTSKIGKETSVVTSDRLDIDLHFLEADVASVRNKCRRKFFFKNDSQTTVIKEH